MTVGVEEICVHASINYQSAQSELKGEVSVIVDRFKMGFFKKLILIPQRP